VNRSILQHCFFWFGKNGADAAITILLPTLKRFSCNGAVGAQHAFAVKAFYKNDDSFVTAEREFRREFGILSQSCCFISPCLKTWIGNFEATGSTLEKKSGSVKTVRSPENITVVREATERSPHRSARRHRVIRAV